MDQVNILVVDSTPKNLEFLTQILVQQNYSVLANSNPESVWEVLESGWAKLVLLNFDVLDLNINEFWNNLQSHSKTQNIPIIFFHSDRQKGQAKYLEIQSESNNIQTDYISNFLIPEEVLIRVKNQLITKNRQTKIDQESKQLKINIQRETSEVANNNKKLEAEIKQHQKTQNTLIKLALHDSITGLPNKNSFLGKIKQLLPKYQQQSEYQFAVLLVGSKQTEQAKLALNYSHIRQLLISIANRLQACLPSSATLSRFESDKFAIILEHITEGQEEIIKWIEVIQKEFSQSFQAKEITSLNLDLEHNNFTCEIGVVLNKNDYFAAYEILLNAEKSLFRAQKTRSIGYHFYTNKLNNTHSLSNQIHPNINNLNLDIFNLQKDIDKDNKTFKVFKDHFYESITREKITLYYHPIFSFNRFAKKDLSNHQIVGLEILDNLHNSYRKILILTNLFEELKEAEFNNYLTNFTLEYACFQIRALQMQNQNQQDFFLTIKLTKNSLLQNLLPTKISNILRETDLDPKSLHLDIKLDDKTWLNKQILSRIQELARLGVFINLDCGNLNHETLIKISDLLPFNSFKIPGIVTPPIINQEDLFTSHSSQTMLSGETEVIKTINLAHQKNITVMAQGIETAEQLKYLSSIDCDYGQGSWFSKPLDKTALESFLIWGT